MNHLAIVILAAGKGTRMRSSLPKVLHPIGGKPMLFHVLDTAMTLNPKKIVVVVSPDSEQIQNAVKEKYPSVKFAIQEEAKGTGHAVMAAIPALDGHSGEVVVLYGDTPLIEAETILAVQKKLNKAAVAVVAFEHHFEGNAYGRVFLDDAEDVVAIIEAKDLTLQQRENTLCNSGIMGIQGHLLPRLLEKVKPNNGKKEYYLTDIAVIARAQGERVKLVDAEYEEVRGVNSQEELSGMEMEYQHYLRKAAQDDGVRFIDPYSTHLRADTKLGKDVVIHPYVVLGDGVVVGDGVEILPFSYIEHATLGNGTRVGPFARIRYGTETAENVHIGNFVEVKNSKIGKGAKINHLSYVGDSEVGAAANIGAGTITCNYDGVNKYKTEIGDGAFIGSNTSLVAPVKIGKGAIIGAGSTITKDVEADALAINTMPQKIEKNGAKRLRTKQQKPKSNCQRILDS